MTQPEIADPEAQARSRLAATEVHRQAVSSLFDLFDQLCDGAIAVDRAARVVWINDKYRALLGLDETEPVLGRKVEEIIPESMTRHVIATGRPILLDIMRFGDRQFVVTRLPLTDDAGRVAARSASSSTTGSTT